MVTATEAKWEIMSGLLEFGSESDLSHRSVYGKVKLQRGKVNEEEVGGNAHRIDCAMVRTALARHVAWSGSGPETVFV